ncbi:hypothetical protein FEP90_00711 [Burkholderia multivorans]|nr:hypothetical protein [Burkholderia multivorans]
MIEQRVDGALVALHDVEHAGRQPGLREQVGDVERGRRVALARLQHERVARRDRDREHPARHHARKVERRDAGDDAERLPHRPVVDAGADLVGVVALQQLRNPAREFDDVDAARDFALRVGEHLAVLGGDDRRERVAMLVHQLQETVQHARAANRRRRGPVRKRRGGRRDGPLYFAVVGQCDATHRAAERRIEDVLEAAAAAGHRRAVEVVADVGIGRIRGNRVHRVS